FAQTGHSHFAATKNFHGLTIVKNKSIYVLASGSFISFSLAFVPCPLMAIPEDILSNESLRKRLEEFLGKQNGIYVDENTHRHLEELCRQMASVYGIVESVLQVALTKEGEERTAYIKTALDISARATRSIKQFLGEWSILVGEANRPRGTP